MAISLSWAGLWDAVFQWATPAACSRWYRTGLATSSMSRPTAPLEEPEPVQLGQQMPVEASWPIVAYSSPAAGAASSTPVGLPGVVADDLAARHLRGLAGQPAARTAVRFSSTHWHRWVTMTEVSGAARS